MNNKSLSLAVTPSVKLRAGQAKLYAFIVEKYQANKVITLNEVIRQYSEYGNRNIVNGEPCYYRYDWKEHRDYLTVLVGDELKIYAVQWFIRNVGLFVIKGLLTAIPTMDLNDIQLEA